MQRDDLLDAKATAARLKISLRTLYAYVSRGKLGRTIDPETGLSLFSAREVADFVMRRDRGKRPENVARASLNYGLPVLESRISTVTGGRPTFRGRDAVAFSESASLEDAAALLWDTEALPEVHPGELGDTLTMSAPYPDRLCGWLLAQASVATRRDVWTRGEALSHASLIFTAAVAIAVRKPHWTGGAHRALARLYGLDAAGGEILRRALVLHADHELNTSTFTVRCVASTMANPYSAVLAGCCAIAGSRHANFDAAGRLIEEAARRRDLRKLVREFTESGRTVPGFGHPLYPSGDPRAHALLDDLRRHSGGAGMELVDRIVQAVEQEQGVRPKNDFAVAAMSHVLSLPADAGNTMFAVSRLVGWLAHALEQYESPLLIRPRAHYAAR